MSYKCDTCGKETPSKSDCRWFPTYRILTSPGYWELLATDSKSEEYLIAGRLMMFTRDNSGFDICQDCQTLLESDKEKVTDYGLDNYFDQARPNAAAVVAGTVWEHIRGVWPESVVCTRPPSERALQLGKQVREVEAKRKVEEQERKRTEAEREKEQAEVRRRIAAEEEVNRNAVEAEARRKATEEEAKRKAEELRKSTIQSQRKAASQCMMCGKALGSLSRLFGRERHKDCIQFRE